jgi:hypothetical protein
VEDARRTARPSVERVGHLGRTRRHQCRAQAARRVELDIAGPSGRITGVALRLYDASARQWSIHYAPLDAGELTSPLFGRFKDGRGEFHGLDTLGGRSILVRFVIACATPDSCRFEQSYSDDGGRTWEMNWIATDTRTASAKQD